MDNYDQSYDYGDDYNQNPNKSIKGYQIIIIVLVVILAALSFFHFRQTGLLKTEYQIQRDTLTNRLTALIGQYDELRTENDTLQQHVYDERERADSLLEQIKKERNISASRIKAYQNEIGTLRNVMQNMVHQLDSVNTVNQRLANENIGYRREVSTQRMRADMAEEKADELSTRIRQGGQLRVRDISLVALSNNDREVTRANRAARLRVDFTIGANELAQPGPRQIHVRIIGPDNYPLANSSGAVFSNEGEMLSYSAMREVDYNNDDLSTRIFYNGTGITGGTYRVQIYIDGIMCGSSEINLR